MWHQEFIVEILECSDAENFSRCNNVFLRTILITKYLIIKSSGDYSEYKNKKLKNKIKMAYRKYVLIAFSAVILAVSLQEGM